MMDGNVYIDGAMITVTDIETTNGVIHVIDAVIMPETGTIVDVATAAGTFTTLLAALDEAALTTTLDSAGTFTVFAPTDDAFADLLTALEIDAAALLADPNLSDILLYHVLGSVYYAEDILALETLTLTTLNGQTVEFSVVDGNVYINDAMIVTTDIETVNGVIHVISAVILPDLS
jgi:uncharacterized surface protein with fasciclin (FAS1) repeats